MNLKDNSHMEGDGEKLLEDALEAGADDVEEEEGEEDEEEEGDGGKIVRVYCQPSALAEARKGLEARGWTPSLVQFSYVPKVNSRSDGKEESYACIIR